MKIIFFPPRLIFTLWGGGNISLGGKKCYLHNELFINLIFFLKFLLILVMKNKYFIIKSLKLVEKDKNNRQKISACSANFHYHFPLKFTTQPHGGHFPTFKPKKTLKI